MQPAPTRALADGNRLPMVGLGTYPMAGDQARVAVREAVDLGYRLVDTAASYDNEVAVGGGIAEADVPRDELVVTSKLRGRDHGYAATLAAFEATRRRLALDRLDLYLIHWPLPRLDRYVDSWRALIKLQAEGAVRSIGVSNFTATHLSRLRRETGILPAVNQIELHPYFTQQRMRDDDAAGDVATQAWRPLGRRTGLLDEPVVCEPAARHAVTPGQVVLRWHVQLGVVPIPKSATLQRQRTNLDVFGFELTADEMAAISALDRGRLGGDPDTHEEF